MDYTTEEDSEKKVIKIHFKRFKAMGSFFSVFLGLCLFGLLYGFLYLVFTFEIGAAILLIPALCFFSFLFYFFGIRMLRPAVLIIKNKKTGDIYCKSISWIHRSATFKKDEKPYLEIKHWSASLNDVPRIKARDKIVMFPVRMYTVVPLYPKEHLEQIAKETGIPCTHAKF